MGTWILHSIACVCRLSTVDSKDPHNVKKSRWFGPDTPVLCTQTLWYPVDFKWLKLITDHTVVIKWVCLKTRYSKIPSLITMFTSSDTPQMKLVCLIGRLRRPPWRVLTCGILWPQEDMRLPGGSFFFPIRNHWSLFQTLGIPGSSKDASSRVFCWRNWKITCLKKCQWTVW